MATPAHPSLPPRQLVRMMARFWDEMLFLLGKKKMLNVKIRYFSDFCPFFRTKTKTKVI